MNNECRNERLLVVAINLLPIGLMAIGFVGAYCYDDFSSAVGWAIATIMCIGNLLIWDWITRSAYPEDNNEGEDRGTEKKECTCGDGR